MDTIRKRKKFKPIKWNKINLVKLKQMFDDGLTHEAMGRNLGISRLAVTHQLRINNLYRLKKPLSDNALNKRNQKEKQKKKESFTPLRELTGKERDRRRKRDSLRQQEYRKKALNAFLKSDRFPFWKYKIKKIKSNTKHRKSVVNKEFTITPDYLEEIWLKQKGKCFFTGLNLIPMADGLKTEHSMNLLSLDRIDNAKGYESGNIRFVSDRINTMRSNLSDQEFYKLCKDITKKYEER